MMGTRTTVSLPHFGQNTSERRVFCREACHLIQKNTTQLHATQKKWMPKLKFPWLKKQNSQFDIIYRLYILLPPKTKTTMESQPFEDVFPIENWGFSS